VNATTGVKGSYASRGTKLSPENWKAILKVIGEISLGVLGRKLLLI
jgi:hypothetical protein